MSRNKQERKKPFSNENGLIRGYTILTDTVRALNLRAFCDSQKIGEQFGEQTAIFEQILTLFEKLDADQRERLLDVLQGQIQSAATMSR